MEELKQPSKLEALIKSMLQSDPDFRDSLIEMTMKRDKAAMIAGTMPYYKEGFAREMAHVLDMMNSDESKRDFIYLYADYPNHRPSSLYLRVNQSLRYLLANLDPTGKYAEIRSRILIDRASNRAGIQLVWVRDLVDGAAAVVPKPLDESGKDYSDTITAFLQDETRGVLHIKNIALTPQEIANIEASVSDMESVCPFITEREIKMIKIDWKPKT